MVEEKDYLERLKTYRTYLEGEVTKYKEVSRKETLRGSSIAYYIADQKVSLLEQVLESLDKNFPELKLK